MKIVGWLVVGVLALGLLWWLMQMIAAESGEVVVLTTTDDAGAAHETRLWLVDHDGSMWLRAGSGVAGWYQRLVAEPRVTLERNDATAAYTARPEAEQLIEINRLMNEKYGWADSYVGFWFSRDDAVPVRLVPE